MNRFLTMAACVLMAHPVLAADTSPRPQLRPADLVTSTVQTYIKNGIEVSALPDNFSAQTTRSQSHSASYKSTRVKRVGGIPTSYYVPNDWTSITSPLANVKVPQDWNLVDNYSVYMQRVKPIPFFVNNTWSIDKCANIIANEWYNYAAPKDNYKTAHCGNLIAIEAHKGNLKPLETAINGLYRGGFHMLDSHDQQFMHSYGQLIYNIVLPYALHRNHLNLDQPKSVIDEWLRKRADNVEMVNPDIGNNTVQPRCHPKKMPRVIVYVDDCNDTRMKITMVKIVMGLQTSDQKLFDEGVESLHYITQFYDEQGVYIGTAMRGGQAIHYSQGFTQLIAMMTEILATVDYDFLAHKLPSGMTVEQMMTFNINMLWSDNIEPLIPYAKLAIGEKGKNWRTLGKQEHSTKSDVIFHNIRWAKRTGTSVPRPEGYQADYIIYPNAIYWANR